MSIQPGGQNGFAPHSEVLSSMQLGFVLVLIIFFDYSLLSLRLSIKCWGEEICGLDLVKGDQGTNYSE